MADYINPDILRSIPQDRPLPIAQSFIDTVNREVGDSSFEEVLAAVTQGALVSIAMLELRLGKLMDALGVHEIPSQPGDLQVLVEEEHP
ncbi:hypothetical protein [Microbacterium sp.]|uniref:hypothetical protein n=1 Tax=Microbacterium sp. TaxID=51671 RepID=UPI0039E6A0D4